MRPLTTASLLFMSHLCSLRLFSQHAVVIGRASHLLPHPTFTWSAVSALVHYDCLDPFLCWNGDGGREFQPAAQLVALIRQGDVESFRSANSKDEGRRGQGGANDLAEFQAISEGTAR